MMQSTLESCSNYSEITYKPHRLTNSTTISVLPCPATQKKTKQCPHYGGDLDDSLQCQAEKALKWLIALGISKGKPEDLFDKARETQRS
jgi:hypothetical protein